MSFPVDLNGFTLFMLFGAALGLVSLARGVFSGVSGQSHVAVLALVGGIFAWQSFLAPAPKRIMAGPPPQNLEQALVSCLADTYYMLPRSGLRDIAYIIKRREIEKRDIPLWAVNRMGRRMEEEIRRRSVSYEGNAGVVMQRFNSSATKRRQMLKCARERLRLAGKE